MNWQTLTNRKTLSLIATVVVIILIVFIQANKSSGGSSQSNNGSSQNGNSGGSQNGQSGGSQSGQPSTGLGDRTKTSGCTVNGQLPDSACTPGAVFASATKEQICVSGYSKSVRNVPEAEKIQVYNSYGIRSHQPGEYEIDHLVSLELGGSNDISNLWPEAAAPQPGFHEKDRYENYAHEQVCRGEISIQEAQHRIATDWLKYWSDAGKP